MNDKKREYDMNENEWIHEQVEATLNSLDHLPGLEMDASFSARLQRRLAAGEPRPALWRRLPGVVLRPALLLILILVNLLTIVVFRQRRAVAPQAPAAAAESLAADYSWDAQGDDIVFASKERGK